MIIDVDVHISPTPEGGNSIGVDELLSKYSIMAGNTIRLLGLQD